MAVKLDRIIEANVASWVRTVCQSNGVHDIETIEASKNKVKHYILDQMEAENIGMDGFTDLLAESLKLLEEQLADIALEESKSTEAVENNENTEEATTDTDVVDLDDIIVDSGDTAEEDKEQTQSKEEEKPVSKDHGYRPQAQNLAAKLEDERKPVKELLTTDCVSYQLVTKKRAQELIANFAGKDPKVAEEEVVIEMRNNLHEQIRKFIRQHNGGPWGTPTEQEEIRLDIVQTPTVRSLLQLTQQLLKERQRWLDTNK